MSFQNMLLSSGVCRDFAQSSKIEWLATNGTGAFAMGTAAGVNTRRYHALLVASLHPPVDRYVLLSRVEEEVEGCALGVAQYPGTIAPRGFENIEQFETVPCPTWRFRVDDASIEKQVYLIDGRQGSIVRYRASRAMKLRVRPFLAYRDYHSLAHARADVYGTLPRMEFHHNGRFEPGPNWYYNHEYLAELDRGLDYREDLFTPGAIVLDLKPGEWTPICASIDGPAFAEPTSRPNPFLVRRADGRPTIIAGYPWFTDWGRDTMISLRGLAEPDAAGEIVEAFLSSMKNGVIPNRYPDSGETPGYNTADASLWLFQAVAALPDHSKFVPALKEIAACYRRLADPADHLLTTGPQLTWMDTKYTPRAGKAVEINALWHAALRILGEHIEANRVRASFRKKFWNPERACLYDVLGDPKIRPNQIFAVSLGFDLLGKKRQQTVVRIVEKELLTPVGLRTLDRADPDYKPRYEGGPEQRDAAYHQGTVWPWLLGPFIDAYLIAFGQNKKTLAYCRGLIDRLETEALHGPCPDSITEIYDADEPRLARGCPAQAWSAAEIARVKAAYFLKKSIPSSTFAK
ncbi:MAG: amylo-alpha-1,6-glucosidase [Bryobacteraceae bacterium]